MRVGRREMGDMAFERGQGIDFYLHCWRSGYP